MIAANKAWVNMRRRRMRATRNSFHILCTLFICIFSTFQFSDVAMNEFAIAFSIGCWRQYEWCVRYGVPYFCLVACLLFISLGGISMMLYAQAHRVCIISPPSSLWRDYCYRAKMFTGRISGKSINNLLFVLFWQYRRRFSLHFALSALRLAEPTATAEQSNTKCIRWEVTSGITLACSLVHNSLSDAESQTMVHWPNLRIFCTS